MTPEKQPWGGKRERKIEWGSLVADINAIQLGFQSHKRNPDANNPFRKYTNSWYNWNRGFNEFYNSIEYEMSNLRKK